MENLRQRGNDIGLTGLAVAQNLKRIRSSLGITQAELSSRLTLRPIPPASIGKIEIGLRKVDVDDLFALAVALDVSPLALLLPDTRRPEETVNATTATTSSRKLWRWALGIEPMKSTTDLEAFETRSLPSWLLINVESPAPESIDLGGLLFHRTDADQTSDAELRELVEDDVKELHKHLTEADGSSGETGTVGARKEPGRE